MGEAAIAILDPDLAQRQIHMWDLLCIDSWNGVHLCLAGSSKHWRYVVFNTRDIYGSFEPAAG
jgi:hypothetical protein